MNIDQIHASRSLDKTNPHKNRYMRKRIEINGKGAANRQSEL